MDLPIHPLAAHLPVVLIPLSSIMLILAVAIRPLRRHLMLVGVVLIGMGAAGAFLAMQSGEQLAATVGEPEAHARWGLPTFLTATALTAVAVVWAWTTWRAGRAAPSEVDGAAGSGGSPSGAVLGAATVVLAVAATTLTILAGHSGAEEVWGGAGGSEEPDGSESAAAQEEPSAEEETAALTMDEVAQHDSADSCWTVVDDTVYDLTEWVAEHPGGEQAIEGLCGTDGTEAFEQQHGGDAQPEERLADFELGPLE
ncbi:cytochrome b5-like heme/steroid binding domain-containing protein [Nesterenkonia aerolata]|uniref:Cytochrome b5-like heme/steroid binding domain-containing protein n=1 Tax=Nesterenkonia aerolata TaxID=3074079 RepID=A0ABU2DNY2_9MICC|nr:cytochrome b5-like heme/steroid binding domain-containing protein [Nesterenkonia sp. LY-0111]MDR8018223.1 cytochrome b5-like heme/steroid binding domain-containing protein [Nesterenkonia sp. LY-0111]